MARVVMWRSTVMSKAKTLYWCSHSVTNGKRAIRRKATAIDRRYWELTPSGNCRPSAVIYTIN